MNWMMNRRTAAVLLGALSLAGAAGVQAHGFKVGDVVIEHPYAAPTPPGSPNGALYLRVLKNTGSQADELVGASTSVAQAVEIHQMELDAQGVMRMRQAPSLPLPAGQAVELRHGGTRTWHLMLVNLKAPLVAGQRFAVTLRFARAGSKEVVAWVQTPREAAAEPTHSHH